MNFDEQVRETIEACWVAFYDDWSELATFGGGPDSELECLRYAVKNHMEVMLVPNGVAHREWAMAARGGISALNTLLEASGYEAKLEA